MSDPTSVKRDFIKNAMRRAKEGNYPIVDPSPEDNNRDIEWWIPVLDAKSFLFSENGSTAWLFPHYQLKLTPLEGRAKVSFQGVTIVDSDRCFEFHETAHPTQIYIPRSEVDFTHLVKSETLSYCPFKNIAEYYSVEVEGERAEDAFWTYENIYETLPANNNADGILRLRGMLSPYRTKLDVEIIGSIKKPVDTMSPDQQAHT